MIEDRGLRGVPSGANGRLAEIQGVEDLWAFLDDSTLPPLHPLTGRSRPVAAIPAALKRTSLALEADTLSSGSVIP
jgi:hypothetical protein